MALATGTISGYFYLPDGVTPRRLHLTVRAETEQNTLKSTAENSVLSGVYEATSDGTGFLSIELPLLADLEPEGALWRATFREFSTGPGKAPTPPSIVFDLTGDTTWDALVDVFGVPLTQTLLAQFQALQDGAIAARETAEAAAAAALLLRDESEAFRDEQAAISGLTGEDAAVKLLVDQPASQTRGSVNLVVARGSKVTHSPAFGVYYPEAEGALGNGTGNDLPAIMAADAKAAAAGGGIVSYAPGANYRITGAVTPSAKVQHIGKHKSLTTVTYAGTYGYMAYDVLVNDSGVSHMRIVSGVDCMVGGEAAVPGSRGLGPGALGCAVFTAGHRNRYEGLLCEKWLNGIRVDNYNVDGLNGNSVYARDQFIRDCDFAGCRFPLIGRANDRLTWDAIRGDFVNATAEPPHLLYFSGGIALACTNMQGSNARAYNGQGGAAFKIMAKGGQISGLYAYNCAGSVQVAESSNLLITDVNSVLDTTPAGDNSIVIDTSINVRVVTAVLKMSTAGRGLNLGSAGQDCTVENLDVDYTGVAGGVALRLNGGLRNRVKGLRVTGDGATTVAIQATGGDQCSVDGLETLNCQTLLSATAGSNLTVRYDPTRQIGVVNDRLTALTGSTATRVIRQGGVREVLVSATGSYQLDVGKAETFLYRMQVASSRPVPRDGTLGQRLTLIVTNETAGAVSVNLADYATAGGWVNPGAGQRRTISFIHDGSRFVESSLGGTVT